MLTKTNGMRDLGVYHDSKLLFDVHVDSIISKASRSLGFVMRISKSFMNIKTLKLLYCTFVRSHLEYASQIWNPRYQTYIDRIESIQRRFLRYLCFRVKIPYNTYSYTELCKKFHFFHSQIDGRFQIICLFLKLLIMMLTVRNSLANYSLMFRVSYSDTTLHCIFLELQQTIDRIRLWCERVELSMSSARCWTLTLLILALPRQGGA